MILTDKKSKYKHIKYRETKLRGCKASLLRGNIVFGKYYDLTPAEGKEIEIGDPVGSPVKSAGQVKSASRMKSNTKNETGVSFFYWVSKGLLPFCRRRHFYFLHLASMYQRSASGDDGFSVKSEEMKIISKPASESSLLTDRSV